MDPEIPIYPSQQQNNNKGLEIFT